MGMVDKIWWLAEKVIGLQRHYGIGSNVFTFYNGVTTLQFEPLTNLDHAIWLANTYFATYESHEATRGEPDFLSINGPYISGNEITWRVVVLWDHHDGLIDASQTYTGEYLAELITQAIYEVAKMRIDGTE